MGNQVIDMLKVGVIGIGSMGRNHARVYSEIADLVGVADMNGVTAKDVADQTETTPFTDYHELLKQDIAAVDIATPTTTHFQVGMDAIEAGKHILVEKPLCSTIEQAQELIDAAHSTGLKLAVGHIERHNPVVAYTKDLIKEGKIGDVISLAARRVSSMPGRIKDMGVIMDLGIHELDALRYLAGDEVVSVYTESRLTPESQYEKHANILLRFKNDLMGFIEVNWLTPMKVRRVSLTCSDAFVEMDYMSQSVAISTSSFLPFKTDSLYQIPQKYDIRRIELRPEEPLKNELLDFINAIEKDGQPLVNGNDGLRVMEVAKAAMESAKTGCRIEL